MLRDAKRIGTCVDFGPRFLHSTGQAYKGGPNTSVFLQITCDGQRDRRALRAHLGADVNAGLETLRAAIMAALTS